MKEKQVAMLVSDREVAPLPAFERWASAFHAVAIPYLGLPLVDNAELEEVAGICAARKRGSFCRSWRRGG